MNNPRIAHLRQLRQLIESFFRSSAVWCTEEGGNNLLKQIRNRQGGMGLRELHSLRSMLVYTSESSLIQASDRLHQFLYDQNDGDRNTGFSQAAAFEEPEGLEEPEGIDEPEGKAALHGDMDRALDQLERMLSEFRSCWSQRSAEIFSDDALRLSVNSFPRMAENTTPPFDINDGLPAFELFQKAFETRGPGQRYFSLMGIAFQSGESLPSARIFVAMNAVKHEGTVEQLQPGIQEIKRLEAEKKSPSVVYMLCGSPFPHFNPEAAIEDAGLDVFLNLRTGTWNGSGIGSGPESENSSYSSTVPGNQNSPLQEGDLLPIMKYVYRRHGGDELGRVLRRFDLNRESPAGVFHFITVHALTQAQRLSGTTPKLELEGGILGLHPDLQFRLKELCALALNNSLAHNGDHMALVVSLIPDTDDTLLFGYRERVLKSKKPVHGHPKEAANLKASVFASGDSSASSTPLSGAGLGLEGIRRSALRISGDFSMGKSGPYEISLRFHSEVSPQPLLYGEDILGNIIAVPMYRVTALEPFAYPRLIFQGAKTAYYNSRKCGPQPIRSGYELTEAWGKEASEGGEDSSLIDEILIASCPGDCREVYLLRRTLGSSREFVAPDDVNVWNDRLGRRVPLERA